MFWHQKLKVYDTALVAAAELAQLSAAWKRKHVFVDHLARASEGVLLNIAEGARLRSAPARQRMLDFAVGSGLESAACLDIAVIKHLLSADSAYLQKQRLCEIVKMLVGLRKAWDETELREESAGYGDVSRAGQAGPLFPHERLTVYQTALEFMRWFTALPDGGSLSTRVCRQLDKAATSVILNIAEGNGRFPEEDRRRFIDTAEASTVKAATYVDLCWRKEGLDEGLRQQGMTLLLSIMRMLHGLARRR